MYNSTVDTIGLAGIMSAEGLKSGLVFRGEFTHFGLLVAFVCQALVEALQHNNALTTLNVRRNEIGAEGGKAHVGVWGAWCGLCLLCLCVPGSR